MFKYDAIAVCLLIFATVVVTAIAIDPKGFSISQWQPLLAALLGIGGALIVYRGATLAYRAAMAKVDLDRENNAAADQRIRDGHFLKLDFAARLLAHEARVMQRRLLRPTVNPVSNIEGSQLIFQPIPDAFLEAWNNIAVFPKDIQFALSKVRITFYNLGLVKIDIGQTYLVPMNGPDIEVIDLLRSETNYLREWCVKIGNSLKTPIAALGHSDV